MAGEVIIFIGRISVTISIIGNTEVQRTGQAVRYVATTAAAACYHDRGANLSIRQLRVKGKLFLRHLKELLWKAKCL